MTPGRTSDRPVRDRARAPGRRLGRARGCAAIALPHARDALTRARLRGRAPGARELAPARAGPGGDRRGSPTCWRASQATSPRSSSTSAASRALRPAGGGGCARDRPRRDAHLRRAREPGSASPGEAREVGRALGRNRFPIVVPCHRVVAAGGGLGGFSAPGGAPRPSSGCWRSRAQARRRPADPVRGAGAARRPMHIRASNSRLECALTSGPGTRAH